MASEQKKGQQIVPPSCHYVNINKTIVIKIKSFIQINENHRANKNKNIRHTAADTYSQ